MSEPRFDHGTGAALAARDREIERLKAENATLRDRSERCEEYRIDGIRSREGSERAHRRIDDLEAKLAQVVEWHEQLADHDCTIAPMGPICALSAAKGEK